MKLKLRPSDFRVREVLRDGYVTSSGAFNVYRVTKRKLTSPEAAALLAAAAGVEVAEVSMAGLKDRQGVTVQYMSVPGGKRVELVDADLRIEPVGSAERPLASTDSDGNAFEIAVRSVSREELVALRRNLPIVRASGVPNYFDDQRFGNLRYNQGWVAKDLMLGRAEDALRRLLCARAQYEDVEDSSFKGALDAAWGDWERCYGISKRNGKHRSLFEHLRGNPADFAGAFRFVATRIRLIHLFAWQSHVFNRALNTLVQRHVPERDRFDVRCIEGPLACPRGAWPAELPETLLLPGAGLDEARDRAEFDLLRDVLADRGLTPGQHRIEGVEGFGLKAEPRAVRVVPQHLRVRPSEPDREHRGRSMVRVRFELPRGAYASLVVKRLLEASLEDRSANRGERDARDGRDDDRGARGGEQQGRGRSFGGGQQQSGPRQDQRRGGPRNDRGSGGFRPPNRGQSGRGR